MPGPSEPLQDRTRLLRRALFVLASLLASMALVAWSGPGLRLTLGPLRVSATNPSHLLLESVALWLIGAVCAPRQRQLALLLPLGAVVLAGVIGSSPRRVGDSAEYVAMTLRMSTGVSPALDADAPQRLLTEVVALPGFADARFDLSPPGLDGSRRFYHFWLYSLLAAPVASVTRAIGAHPVYAFTAVNVLLILTLAWWLVAHGRSAAAVLIVAGPLLWWVDKAHAEVFLFVLIAFATLLVDRHPLIALLAAAVAAAQNPAALVVVVVCCIAVFVRHDVRRGLTGILLAAAILAVPQAYYWWTMGTWSPLVSTIGSSVPGMRALITPLLDPNLGLLPYAPVLMVLAVLGASRVSRPTALACGSAAALLLLVVAQSANVNHGGTPGMSRYALWLLAILVPLVAEGAELLKQRHPDLLVAAITVSVACSLWLFRPALEERHTAPNWFTTLAWSRWPGLDNPLPEVFADRVGGADGQSVVPVATRGCSKVLTRGDGDAVWWPFPCTPSQAPDECVREGALCYVNNGVFRRAPAQPLFSGLFRPAHAWTLSTLPRLRGILTRLGPGASSVRLGGGSVRAVGGSQLTPLYIVEGQHGAAVWVQPAAPAVEAAIVNPSLQVSVASASTIEIMDGTSLVPVQTARSLPPGAHTISLEPGRLRLVLVADTP